MVHNDMYMNPYGNHELEDVYDSTEDDDSDDSEMIYLHERICILYESVDRLHNDISLVQKQLYCSIQYGLLYMIVNLIVGIAIVWKMTSSTSETYINHSS
jgi:hypothetical protein